jgi:LuxR family transcriptional regulator, maltose regulon positive regulatory protein
MVHTNGSSLARGGNGMVRPPHGASLAGPAREREDLLSTKLTIPRIRPDRLARARLLEALSDAMTRELVLVCTPAGFGKTTLLADWSTEAKMPVAWLSLDPDDNDPARFWRYVVAALDRVCEGLGDQLWPLLTGPGSTSSHGMVTALINQIEAQSSDLVLVLDDYHLIESPLIHDGLALLLTRISRRLHVALATRGDPPLPLSRLRARDQLAELRAADLRFTSAESALFLQQVWHLDISPEVIAALETRTEGWAVGLQLAALSLRDRPDPDAFLNAFTGSHRYVLDYLTEEVLERQPDRIRDFLLHSSILERMTGPLCEVVTGDDDGQGMLEQLERANLFIVPLDEQRRWYRFHNLFAEALRVRLQRVDAGQVLDLHRRAADWCERHGLIDDAIRHASGARDPTRAAQLVEQHLNETLQRGETAILERWIALLPDDAVRTRPGLCLAQGMLEFHGGHLDAAEQRLEYADRAFEHGPGMDLQLPTDGGMVSKIPAATALLRAELSGVRGDPERLASFARSALEHTADHEWGPRLWARTLLASADWISGRLADAEAAFAEILAEARVAPEAYPMLATCFPLGRVQHARGKLEAALRTYEDGLRFATGGRTLPNLYLAAESHIGMAQVLYERDELDRALHHITAGIELGQQVVDLTTPLLGLVVLAWIRQSNGDRDGALTAMNEACELRSIPDVIAIWNPAPSELARLLLLHGRIEEASRWTVGRRQWPDGAVCYSRERDYLLLARVLVTRGLPEQALDVLERLERMAQPQGNLHSLIQIRTVRALALQAAGDHPGALSVLAEALALARPEGFIRIFADEGAPMAALLRSLLSAHSRARVGPKSARLRQQVNRILQAFGTAVPAAGHRRPVSGIAEALTRREVEVLRLIADGRHNREIAQDLFVTIDTVKKHASNILSKLDATGRTHAVARARDLGVLP